MKNLVKEFKEFISRGNVMDLAVGVIIGKAFGDIVTSLVNNVLMPLIGVVLGGIDFSGLSFTVKSSVIKYGEFLQSVFDFLIVAACIFAVIKFMNKLQNLNKKEEIKEEVVEEPKLTKEEELLTEIRDLLKKKK